MSRGFCLVEIEMIPPAELSEILGPSGQIARAHPNYEFRPGQIRMAQAVGEAIDARHHLCVEAGTGTGKTLAYLLPCISSSKRVIISTGTKNLQEQIFFKDLPFLEKALGQKFSVCYVKGRSNYLCLKKLAEIDEEGYLFSRHDPEYLETIRTWARVTETGDRAELKELPDDFLLWHHLDARRETCTGQKCSDFDSCFITKVRQRALGSDIVIVNHHLFFADLALRLGDFGSVLPDYSVVIFDEAHELEDVVTQYFGIMVSSFRLEEFARDSSHALSELDSRSTFLEEQVAKLPVFSGEFFGAFRGQEGRFPLRELGGGQEMRRGPQRADPPGEAYRKVLSQLSVIETALKSLPVQSDAVESLQHRCLELRDEMAVILESDSTENVYWYEVRGRGVFLWASPIRVSSILADRLFAQVDTAILTSATLSTGGNFQFIRSRLGLGKCKELILDSHFDFARQAVFYVPREIPEPREEGWAAGACIELERILEASRGRAFVLFTSYAQMEMIYRSLQPRLRYPMFVQGEKSKSGLLDAFRKTPNAVLFATFSFWQGVDVQGEQLSCVVIDKLPFSVPSDPVVAARIRHLNETGGSAFYDYQIPEAIILLKQGLGRLIRSRADRGILALLDKRILTRSYGRSFLESLPPAPLTHNFTEVRNFLAGMESS
jgi:ATP-dependent DNA helicase DinG